MHNLDRLFFEHRGPHLMTLSSAAKRAVKHMIARCARDFEGFERASREEEPEEWFGEPSRWVDHLHSAVDYMLDCVNGQCLYSEHFTGDALHYLQERDHSAVVRYLRDVSNWHERNARIERNECPGCGCNPGDGITADCSDMEGCGYYADFLKKVELSAHRSGTDVASK
jgi:hypothetical protein